jgi:hypothetical protein
MAMIQTATVGDLVPITAANRTLRRWRLGVVNQLLGDLDTVTVAGLTFTMGKVIGLLRQEVGGAEAGLSKFQRRVMTRALDDLAHEQDRLLPDADRFVARTQIITDTLALV